MQAVILVAGKGTRMGALTQNTPKPLLKVAGLTLIEHKLLALPAEVTEVIFVIGYLGEQIKNYFGMQFNGRKISYVEDSLQGTAKALWAAQSLLTGRFLLLMGDDLYAAEDIRTALTHERTILVKEMPNNTPGGKIMIDEAGSLIDIVEDRKGELSYNLVNIGLYVLTPEIFNYEPVQLPNSTEYGLPQTMLHMLKDYPINVVKAGFWMNMSAPEDLEKAEDVLKTIKLY
jgi:UDP-N-acetylglucosamine diphosphorylase / glucose-1-phosphate thymidylyltransferase / UDP-N-acetylgalactosamine diphosphorylase / glucosamine-1-phosphate N-acetyltransferase / galactosamine-1-phosphate N-acetyltransferase